MKKPEPTIPTPAEDMITGLEANAAALRVSITQREKRHIGPFDDKAGLSRVLSEEKRSLLEIEKEIEAIKKTQLSKP